MKGFVSLCIFHLNMGRVLILCVNFASCYFAECVYQLEKFLGRVLGSFIYKIVSPVNKDTLTSSFATYIPSISISCLIALAQTILDRYGGSGQPCFVPDFSGNVYCILKGLEINCISPHLQWSA